MYGDVPSIMVYLQQFEFVHLTTVYDLKELTASKITRSSVFIVKQ